MQSESKPIRDKKAAMPSIFGLRRRVTGGWFGHRGRETCRLAGVSAGRLPGRWFRRRGRRAPGKTCFAEVDFGGGDDATLGRHPYVVSSCCVGAAPEIEAYLSAGFHARLGVRASRLHGERTATKW
eukprot:5663118-Pleurochrysis_carterae.AAC.2